jgi:hypothetical protein
MPYGYESIYPDHKITDADTGKVIATFEPNPTANPAKGIFPTRGVFTTDDKKVAQTLEALGDQGVTRSAGSDDPGPEAKPTGKPAA